MIVNMIVDLAGADFSDPADDVVLRHFQVTLRHRSGVGDDERRWIARAFGGRWPEEAAAGSNWFAYDRRNRPIGFATYEQRAIRWWWLDGWWDRKEVGLFGPTGVAQAMRGRSIGCILTRRALASMQERGFARALIPAVGPVRFYERCCGARVVERLRGFRFMRM